LVTTPNNEDSEKRLKTAINIPFSPYEYIRMPFSLTNVPALHGRSPARIGILFHIYKNDVLVAYPDHEKHSEYIVKALSRWKRNCSYKPVVTTVNDSRSSTRSLSAFHPVSCYVTGTAKKRFDLQDVIEVYEEAKQEQVNATVLRHRRHGAALYSVVDASGFSNGAVFRECLDGRWSALFFFLQILVTLKQYRGLGASCLPSILVFITFNIGMDDDIASSSQITS
ncbi:hypothetical protein T4E_7620, partial [Trichinella pseudospiralis]